MYKAMSGKKEKKKTQESEAEVEGEVEGRVGDGNDPSRYERSRNCTVFWQQGFQFAILDWNWFEKTKLFLRWKRQTLWIYSLSFWGQFGYVLPICGTVKVSYVEQSPPPSPSLVEGEVEGGLEGGVGEVVRVGGEGGVEIKPELKIEIVKEVCKEIVQVELTKRPEIVTPAKTETNFYLDTSQMELKKKTETAGFITTEIQVGDDK